MRELVVTRGPKHFAITEMWDDLVVGTTYPPLTGGVFSLSDGKAAIINDLGVIGIVPPVRHLLVGHAYTLEE